MVMEANVRDQVNPAQLQLVNLPIRSLSNRTKVSKPRTALLRSNQFKNPFDCLTRFSPDQPSNIYRRVQDKHALTGLSVSSETSSRTQRKKTRGWNYYNSFPDVLLKPARGGKRHNLTNTIKSRCADNKTGHNIVSNIETTSHRKCNLEATLAAAVSSKIEDGNLKAAIRLLCSEETVAPFDSDTHAQLRAKHPPSSLHPSQIEPPDGFPSLILIGEDVADAVRSFPAGSSGGPDGLKPIHLSDMMACQEVKHELIAVVTEFLNLLMDGICPPSIRRIIFGGRLIALNKKGGGIRPIAIGYYWRRLAAKCANNIIAARLRGYFSPLQVGVGVKGGCEAAIHAVRRFLQDMPDDFIVAKLDFTNAFNCICRSEILRRVAEMLQIYINMSVLRTQLNLRLHLVRLKLFLKKGCNKGIR